MKQLASADFRKAYHSQSEPVEVTAHGKVIGRWFPEGSTIDTPALASEMPSEDLPEPRMTIRPAKGPKKELQATSKRVIDPMEAARLERERWSQLASRMYGGKKGPVRNPERQ